MTFLFYSILMIKKCLQTMPRWFSFDLFALKNDHILHTENLTSNIFSGYFNEHNAALFHVAYNFEFNFFFFRNTVLFIIFFCGGSPLTLEKNKKNSRQLFFLKNNNCWKIIWFLHRLFLYMKQSFLSYWIDKNFRF